MTTPTHPDALLKLKSIFRLQWEPAQDAHVLLYPEGMVKLNQSAAEILKRCDGTRDIDTLIDELQKAFNAPDLGGEVRSFVAEAERRGWLESGQ
jgi:pyrroloquinoline quinone biosynthesis protein D